MFLPRLHQDATQLCLLTWSVANTVRSSYPGEVFRAEQRAAETQAQKARESLARLQADVVAREKALEEECGRKVDRCQRITELVLNTIKHGFL